MAQLLYRLGRTAYRKWPIFLVVWILAIAGVGGFAAANSKPMSDTFSIPGIPSLKAASLQAELFPGQKDAAQQVGGQLVVAAPAGHKLSEEPYKSDVNALVEQLKKAPQMPTGAAAAALVNPAVAGPMQTQKLVDAGIKQGLTKAQAEANAQALSSLSKDGRIGVISWDFNVEKSTDVKTATQNVILQDAKNAQKNGVVVAAGGQGMQQQGPPGGNSELIGIAVALVVLVLTFGSFIAAGMPILNAIVGLMLGTLGITAATAFFTLPSTTTSLASMIGLAVGIDYALFILSRFRSELSNVDIKDKDQRAHAMGRALGTAGSAVVFAGLTVLIALSAFAVLGIGMLSAMGLGAAFTVFLAVCVSLTLLPALMGMLRTKAFGLNIRRKPTVGENDTTFVNNSVRMGRAIRKAPWAVAIVVVAVLGALAVPVSSMHLGLPTDADAAKGTQARISADLMKEGWGPGKNAPMIAVIDGRSITGSNAKQVAAERMKAFGQVAAWVSKDANVSNAQIVQVSQKGDGAVVLVTPKTGPDDLKTDKLLTRLRDGQKSIEASSHTKIGITGTTPIQTDVSNKLSSALPPYLAIVVGLAFVLLVLVFRSIIVPLLATSGFLLSVLATLGVAVKLVQDGVFGIFEKQPIMSFMPTLLIGIVFGLAMDYQVFLTTRMREAYAHGMNARDAVIDGYRHSGRVVVAAACIMISVFAAFATQDNALIKEIGLSLAVAVLFDAFLVRMILIPSVMLMLGDKAWWMPKWLDKILPNVDVEGEGLSKSMPGAATAHGDAHGVEAGAGVAAATHHEKDAASVQTANAATDDAARTSDSSEAAATSGATASGLTSGGTIGGETVASDASTTTDAPAEPARTSEVHDPKHQAADEAPGHSGYTPKHAKK